MRDLFIFAGQSNMMGAAAFPPDYPLNCKTTVEYKHKARRFGESCGEFVPISFDVGEFSYKDPSTAYSTGSFKQNSTLNNYSNTAYFVPAMCNCPSKKKEETKPFDSFSEAEYTPAPSLPPYLCELWESMGRSSAVCSVAKGAVSIRHYCDQAMVDAVNSRIANYNKTHSKTIPFEEKANEMSNGASKYFTEKVADFIDDSRKKFRNELSGCIPFFWLQGESDPSMTPIVYYFYLCELWNHVKKLGATHFFCIRVGFWGASSTAGIMAAQEAFCKSTNGAYIVTRILSFIPLTEDTSMYKNPVPKEYFLCRDSFTEGINNWHYNQIGFIYAAKPIAKNIYRILAQGKESILEDEKIIDFPTLVI